MRHLTMKRRQFGQGMSEYIIITALVAVAGIGLFAAFGDTLGNQMAAMSKEMAGQAGDDNVQAAADNAETANTRASQAVTLSSYPQRNCSVADACRVRPARWRRASRCIGLALPSESHRNESAGHTVSFTKRHQRGQILPLAAFGILIAGAALVMMYNAGQKVTEKSLVANAADAAAYSAGVWTARHLNYM